MRINKRRRRIHPAVKFLSTIIALAGVSLCVAFAWQNAEDALIAEEAEKNANSRSSAFVPEEPVVAEPASVSPYIATSSVSGVEPEMERIKTASEAAAAVASSRPDSSDNSDSPASANYARELIEGAVPFSKPVGYNYFDDAIFFGDSISTGIPLYMKTTVPNTAVIAAQGVSPEGANTSQCIDVNGTRVTMLEAAKTKGERKKVYVMLGANALDMDNAPFMKGYRTFIESLKSMYPKADIYIQSMLPVTATVNKTYPSKNINNQRISEYNSDLIKMAAELQVYYVDVAQCMVGEDGTLPAGGSPFDGMHLTPEYYIKWFDYLRSHTVQEKNSKGK